MGDEVLRAGDLKGATLTRRSLQDLVASGKPHVWTVRREGLELHLRFAPGDPVSAGARPGAMPE